MAQEKNTVLRVIIPVMVLAGALLVGWAVMRNTSSHQQRPPAVGAGGNAAAPGSTPADQSPAAPANLSEDAPRATGTHTTAASSNAPAAAGPSPTNAGAAQPPPGNALAASQPGPTGVRALPWPVLTPQDFTPIGSLAAPSGTQSPLMQVTFSRIGAGIERIEMADHFVAARPGSASVKVQEAARLEVRGRTLTLVPFSLLGVAIDGTFVNLSASPEGPLWRETAPGAFEAIIVDDAGTPVARVRRAFVLVPGSHEITLDQSLENLSGSAYTVQWVQMGPVDPPSDSHNSTDLRRVRLGYLSPAAIDPEQTTVLADTRFLMERPDILGEPSWNQSLSRFEFATRVIWPDPRGRSERYSLAWVSTTNHYFAAVLHAAPDRSPPRVDTLSRSTLDKRLHAGATVDRIAITSETLDAHAAVLDARFGLRLTSAPMSVAPGATSAQALGVYAGPMDKSDTKSPPVVAQMGLGGLVIYYLGGPCAWCMFQPVAASLHWYLQFLHDYVVFDWAIGITLLVLTLRTILHPMTKWSQRSMIVMGKKMSGLAPKQKKLQEKFGSDPKRLREEQAKLMQEEGVGASSVLGCAPMFVQMLVNTPIWIGLSGAIFTAFDLRHEAAFYGVFQKIGAMFGSYWPFLADLSDQDRFIPLPFTISLWVISISSINILPFVLGFVFYFQQKYLTPPPTTQLTPEQEQQQKIMKIMMVVLFPVMMYNQPAALVLYFAVNSIFGSLEAAHIRKQFEVVLKEREARGATEVRRRSPDRGAPAAHSPAPATGFFARLRQQLELAQQVREERLRQQQRDNKRTR